MTRPACLLGSVALLALTACPPKTDYGQTCKMTKPNPDGTTSTIQVSELTNSGFDYVALGSPECDDLVCLRSANACTGDVNCAPGTCTDAKCGDQYSDPADGSAVGYCTRGCLEDSDCEPDFDGKKTLKCQQLLMSEEQLTKLKAQCDTDPDCLYNQIFGSGASAKYCIKPMKCEVDGDCLNGRSCKDKVCR